MGVYRLPEGLGWGDGCRVQDPSRGGKTTDSLLPRFLFPQAVVPRLGVWEGLNQTRCYRQQVGPQGGQTDTQVDGKMGRRLLKELCERAVLEPRTGAQAG